MHRLWKSSFQPCRIGTTSSRLFTQTPKVFQAKIVEHDHFNEFIQIECETTETKRIRIPSVNMIFIQI